MKWLRLNEQLINMDEVIFIEIYKAISTSNEPIEGILFTFKNSKQQLVRVPNSSECFNIISESLGIKEIKQGGLK